MNILHVTTSLDRGGAETQLLTLARKQVKENSVTVFSVRAGGSLNADFIASGISLRQSKFKFSLGVLLQLRRILRSGNYDILHAHLPRAEVISRIALLCMRTQFIVSRHNYESFIPNIAPKLRLFSTLLSRFVTRRASAVIGISDSVCTLIKSYKEVGNEDKISRIYYGYDEMIQSVHILKDEMQGPKNFGTLSRLVPQKRLDVLLRAFTTIKLEEEHVYLTIVGSGKQELNLKRLAKNLGVSGSVTWISNTQDRLKIMSDFHFFVLTSEYEGFGLVLLEAIQMGVPIIATRSTSIVEVLGEEYIGLFRNGDVEDLVEKLRLFLDFDENQIGSIMDYLRGRLKRFSPDEQYRQTAKLYDDLISGSSI